MTMKQQSFGSIAILAGIAALPPLFIDMNLPAIPDMEAAFHIAQGQGSLTFSLFLLGFSIAPMWGGPLSDRYGRKPTLLVALAMGTLSAAACMLDFSFSFLLVARLVQGIACGVCILIPLAMVRDTSSGATARKRLSTIMVVGGVAPLVAPILGSALLLFGGWPTIYGAQSALSLVLFAFIAVAVAETLPQEKRNAIDLQGILSGYRDIFTNAGFLGFALPQAFGFGCLFAYVSGSPGLMLGEIHLSEQAYSLVFGLTSCGVMVGSLVSGILGHWEVHARRIVGVTLLLLTVSAAAVVALTWGGGVRLPVLLPLLFLVMGCFGLVQPNAMSEAIAPWGHMAGAASGAVNSLQMLVGAGVSALMPLLVAALGAGKGMSLAMLCTAFLAMGCSVAFGRAGGAVRQGNSA